VPELTHRRRRRPARPIHAPHHSRRPASAPTIRARNCAISTAPALAAIIAGSPLVFTQFVVYEPRTTAIIAKDDSGINKIEDLVGKSVAVNGSGLGEFLPAISDATSTSIAAAASSPLRLHRSEVGSLDPLR
jgi:hypothetical protein